MSRNIENSKACKIFMFTAFRAVEAL